MSEFPTLLSPLETFCIEEFTALETEKMGRLIYIKTKKKKLTLETSLGNVVFLCVFLSSVVL